MFICPNCRELYGDEYVEEKERRFNRGFRRGRDDPDEWQNAVCPDCGEELIEARLCPICGETYITDDEATCDDCDKYARFAETVYQKCEDLYFALIKMYAGRNEKALVYMRDLYEDGLL